MRPRFDRPPFAWARDLDRMVARLVLHGAALELAAKGGEIEIDGAVGEEIATALGLPAIPEASDDLGRTWGDAKALVIELAGQTRVACASAARLARWRKR